MNIVRCHSLLASIMTRCYDVVDMDACHFFLGVLDSMMWMLNTWERVTCIN